MNNDEFVEMMEALPISASFIETIAISQSFLVRKGSISPMDFLYALCCLSTGGTVSFNDMAAKIDAGTAVSVSRQAIARKMGKISCTAFLKKILALCIIGRIGRKVEDRDNLQVVEKQYGVLKNSYGVTKPTLDNTVCQIYHDNHMHSVHIFSGKKNNIKQNEKRIKHAQRVVRYLMKNPAKILKLINVIKQNPKQQGNQLQALARYCSYEKRKRSNFEADFNAIIWP